jgi:hypothetical protein
MFFGEAVLQQKAKGLPRLRSISTGELPGPFEIDLEALRSRIETPILQTSTGKSELTCGMQGQALVINSGGLPVVKCGPPEQVNRRLQLPICGTDQQPWGTMKPRGRDISDVYWYMVQPEYSTARTSGAEQPTILIAQVDPDRGVAGPLKVCLHSGQALIPVRQAEELKIAEAEEVKDPSVGDILKVHIAKCNINAVLMLSLVLSVKVFDLKFGLPDDRRDQN